MNKEREFLVLQTGKNIAVYSRRNFPMGVPLGPDAQRLRIAGPSRAVPPETHFTQPEFDRWRAELEAAGFTFTLGPFWRNPKFWEDRNAPLESIKTTSLKEAFDELLREAERRGQADDHLVEAVEPSHP